MGLDSQGAHLQFADDTMFFLSSSKENVKAPRNLLIWLEIVPELKINLKNPTSTKWEK